MTPYAPPGTTAARILTIVSARPGVLVGELPEILGLTQEAVNREVWTMCRHAILTPTDAFGKVALRVAS